MADIFLYRGAVNPNDIILGIQVAAQAVTPTVENNAAGVTWSDGSRRKIKSRRHQYISALSNFALDRSHEPTEQKPTETAKAETPKVAPAPFDAKLAELGPLKSFADLSASAIIAQMQRDAQNAADLALKRKRDDEEAIALLLLS